MCFGGQRAGFRTYSLPLSDNSAETGESFGDAAASVALQQQADGKESKIGHANTIGGMLQCLFHFGADAHFVYQLLKFGADRRPNLTGYQLDCLGRGQTGPDGADDQIERVWECVQELSLVPASQGALLQFALPVDRNDAS